MDLKGDYEMGLFDKLMKGKEQKASITFPATLCATAKGTFVPMNEIPDPVFSQGVLGVCCGIEPMEGKIYSPIDGKISQTTDTGHAIGVEAGGMDILIHVGIDTVGMNGKGFAYKVKLNQMVKRGDLLLTMDLDAIREDGHPTTVITAITNSDDFASVEAIASGTVQPGDSIIRVAK